MSHSAQAYLLNKLSERRDVNNFRSLKSKGLLVDFFSNDYLGFARKSALKEAAIQELNSLKLSTPNGSTGSRLLSGNYEYICSLENQLARFHEADSALIFNSGYDANLGVLSSIPHKNATIFFDELVHASMHDGMRLSRANKVPFRHNDIHDLADKMSGEKGLKFIAVEALYSMDGDMAPLKQIVQLAKEHDAAIILDEAHSNGIFGSLGEGKAQAEGLHKDVFIRIHTFGKAIGAHGAVVLGNQTVKDFLVNYCRPFIFSTALPPHSVAAIKVAYDYLPLATTERISLNENIKHFRFLCIEQLSNFQLIDSNSPIQGIIIQGNSKAKQLADAIQATGFDVRAILSPTVPKGKERIRICLHSFNSYDEIQGLVHCIGSLSSINSLS